MSGYIFNRPSTAQFVPKASAAIQRSQLDLRSMATQPSSAVLITGGGITGTPIGASVPSSANFTSINLTSGFSSTGSISASSADITNGIAASSGQFTNGISASSGDFVSVAVSSNLTANHISNTPIGATGASSGDFTALSATSFASSQVNITGGSISGVAISGSTFSSTDVAISGGYIAGTPIGATNASSGNFTALDASSNFTGVHINLSSGLNATTGTFSGGVTASSAAFTNGVTASSGGFTLIAVSSAGTFQSVSATSSVSGQAVSASSALTGSSGGVTNTWSANHLSVTSGVSASSGTINIFASTAVTLGGGTIANVAIGATAASSADFTGVSLSSNLSAVKLQASSGVSGSSATFTNGITGSSGGVTNTWSANTIAATSAITGAKVNNIFMNSGDGSASINAGDTKTFTVTYAANNAPGFARISLCFLGAGGTSWGGMYYIVTGFPNNSGFYTVTEMIRNVNGSAVISAVTKASGSWSFTFQNTHGVQPADVRWSYDCDQSDLTITGPT